MHCQICDYSCNLQSDYSNQFTAPYYKPVQYDDEMNMWLCSECSYHINLNSVVYALEDES
jgi:hypothetical protein